MNWNQLEYVLTVAEQKNITHAAEKLHLSQPSLSMSIKALEREFGVTLFERRQGVLEPTYGGKLFCTWAESTLQCYRTMENKLNDISQNKRHFIRFGISPHRSTILLPPILEKFYALYPDCEVQITEHPAHILRHQLEEKELDVILDIPHPDTINYINEQLAEERVILAIPQSFVQELPEELRRAQKLALKHLEPYPFILLSREQVLGQISRRICDAAGLHPNVRLTCMSVERALALASRQLGVTLVPEIFAQHHQFLSEIRYYLVDECQSTRPLCLVYQKNLYQSDVLKALLQLFRVMVPDIYSFGNEEAAHSWCKPCAPHADKTGGYT